MKFIQFLLIALYITLILYIAGSIINLDILILGWEERSRTVISIFWSILLLINLLSFNTEFKLQSNNKNKHEQTNRN